MNTSDKDDSPRPAAPASEPASPGRFTTLEDEWAAVRQGCGLLDAGGRGLLRLSGSDRIEFLQGMLSNDVVKLAVGEGTYAAVLTQQAKVISDLRVYVLADEVWLDVPAGRVPAVRESLERFLVADDVEFVDDPAVAPLFALEGPQAAGIVAGLIGSPPPSQAFAHAAVTVGGTPLHVARVTHTGEAGYLFFGPPDSAARLVDQCRAAGAQPVGSESLDVLRLEAGIAWHGRDMDESTLIGEAGLDDAVSHHKGCYLGQEVVERVAARGQVQRRLIGLRCDGAIIPEPGVKLSHDGQEVGWITSAAWSPAAQGVIALAYVRREWWEPGTALAVAQGGVMIAARVVALPFRS